MRVAPRTKIVFGSSRICFITFPDVFYFMRQCIAVSAIIFFMLSGCISASCAARFLCISPHFVHLYTMIYPFFGSGMADIGSIGPRHSFALSPGFMSTCIDQRQKGQWSRELLPRGFTSLPQFRQINPLSFLENLFTSIVFTPKHSGFFYNTTDFFKLQVI